MKAPQGESGDNGKWERTLARFFTANRIPLTWGGAVKGFTGISGYTIRRIAPMRSRYYSTASWKEMPAYFRERQHLPNMIVVVTNRKYGDDIEDSLVVMRLGTFAPIFATHINSDRERYIHAPHSDG